MASKSKSKNKSKATTKSINSSIKVVNKSLSSLGLSNLPQLTGKKEKTAKEVYKSVKIGDPDYGIDEALDKGIKYYGDQAKDFDEEDIRGRQLGLFQKEIDATNAIYADMLASAALEGRQRLGSTRARSAREGVLGSDFGNANKEATLGLNRGIETAIQNEKQGRISGILGKANEAANNEIIARRAAQKEGLDKYLEFIGTKNERKEKYKKDLAQSFIDQGITPDEIDPNEFKKIAKNYGLKTEDIIDSYTSIKKANDEAEKERQEKLKKELSFNLSEGQDRYEYNPVTGEYDLVASKQKTYAPKDGDGLSGADYKAGENPTVDAYAAQVRSGAIKLSQVPKEFKDRVAQALSGTEGGYTLAQRNTIEARDLVNELINDPGRIPATGKSAFKAVIPATKARTFRRKAKQLESLLSLEAIQQMRGLGALSDMEGQRIANSVSILGDRYIKEEDYLAELTRLRDTLEEAAKRIDSGAGVDEADLESASGSTVQVQSPDGTIGTIPAEDLDEALAEGYMQL